MEDAGMALMESMDADIHDNTIENVKWGVRLSVGAARNNIYDNTFHNCLQCEPVVVNTWEFRNESSGLTWAAEYRHFGSPFLLFVNFEYHVTPKSSTFTSLTAQFTNVFLLASELAFCFATRSLAFQEFLLKNFIQ